MAKYDIDVQLTGQNGNVYNLMSLVIIALREHGVSKEEQEQFKEECRSGDYDNALRTMGKWVNVY